MKAKFVYENIHFERGVDPKAAMGLGMREKMKKIMKKDGYIHENDDNAALHWASYYGYINFVKFLLEAGANIHVEDNRALRWASRNGHTDVVEVLLKAGANVHALDDYALQYALKYGHEDIVKLLKKWM